MNSLINVIFKGVLILLAGFFFQAQAFSETSVEGLLILNISDKIGGYSDKSYLLDTGSKKLEVNFKNSPKTMISGEKVILRGNFTSTNVFQADSYQLETDGRNGKKFAVVRDGPLVLTVLVSLNGKRSACSVQGAKNALIDLPTSLRNHVSYSTRGKVNIDFDYENDNMMDIVGPVYLPKTYSECSPEDWAKEADILVKEMGVPLHAYDSIIYILPSEVEGGLCDFRGQGRFDCLGKYQCRSWSFQCYESVFIHEFGHNLGMFHASFDSNNDNIAEEGDIYRDGSCPMGYSKKDHLTIFNAPHQDEMGWFDPKKNMINEVLGSGGFRLVALEAHRSVYANPLAIRIPRKDGGYWYLSYRVKGGRFPGTQDFFYNKLSIHRFSKVRGDSSFLIKTLAKGEKFQDPHTQDVFEVKDITSTSLSFTYKTSHGPDEKICSDDFSCHLVDLNADCPLPGDDSIGVDNCRARNYLKAKRKYNVQGKHACVYFHNGRWWNGEEACNPESKPSRDFIDTNMNPSIYNVDVDGSSSSSCIDSDGDGWGWDGSASCRVEPSSSTVSSTLQESSTCIDPDGDGWGWDGEKSCRVLK